MRSALPAVAVLVALGACGTPERETSSARPTTSTIAPAVVRSGRQLTDAERTTMLATLGADPGHTAWFAVTAADPEAVALKDAFAAVFRQAGWQTETQPVTGMMLKPGLSILIAAEQPPPHVALAQQALQSTSYEFKIGTGYGAYYAERKQADPRWPGIPLAAGQDFVVVVGPKPPPAPGPRE